MTAVEAGPLLGKDLAAIGAAILAQQDRRLRRDPRLPKLTPSDVTCHLARLLESQAPVVVAKSADLVVGLAVPDLQVYGPDSDMLTYWPSRKGEARELVLSCADVATAGVARALLKELDTFWAAWRVTGAGLVWPTRDIDLGPELACDGFKIDAQLAFRDARQQRTGPEGQRLRTRHVTRPDVDAVVDVYLQVIDAHIPASPFARHTTAAEPAFQERLEALLSSEPEDADAFVLVGDLDGHVVAMADCWVSTIGPALSPPLPPGRYGYINSFGVSSTRRRGGIGKEFHAALEREFSRRHVLGTYLWFSEYNVSARNFWPSLGYQAIWTSYQRRAALDEGAPNYARLANRSFRI